MRWKKHVLFSSCFMLLNSLPSILTGIITGGKSHANNRKRRIFSWKWHDYIIKISNYSCVFFHAIISIFNRLILCVSPSVSLSPVVFDSTKWLNESNYSSFCLRAIQKCFHNCCFVWWASISSVDVCVCVCTVWRCHSVTIGTHRWVHQCEWQMMSWWASKSRKIRSSEMKKNACVNLNCSINK